jgi:hypothetical protein
MALGMLFPFCKRGDASLSYNRDELEALHHKNKTAARRRRLDGCCNPSAGMIRIRFCGSRAVALLSAWVTGSPLGCVE